MTRYVQVFAVTVVSAALVCSIAYADEQATSSRSWPCFGATAHNFKADYTAYVGSHIDFVAHARCGAADSVATIDAGSLPPGLTLRGGNITGVPQSSGDFYFSLEFLDPKLMRPNSETATFHMRIVEAPPVQ